MSAGRIHHLNCASFAPPCARLVAGRGGWLEPGRMVSHCLLIETASHGLVLVDTGLGTLDIERPNDFSPAFRYLLRPELRRTETARAQLEALGFAPRDVRHIVTTHLDLDHAGGIADFAWATVHVHALEREAARARQTFNERARYLPRQLERHEHWQTYADEGDAWFGLHKLAPLVGLEDIALVPLFGHTRGHSGVAVRSEHGWLLHAGDAYFCAAEVADPRGCPRVLDGFQRMLATDDLARRRNRERLARLSEASNGAVRVFCAHDPSEFAALAASAGR